MSDQQEFGWLDEILFDSQDYYSLNAENEFVRTELRTDWVKTAIIEHFTAQLEHQLVESGLKAFNEEKAKQHQIELLRARIDEEQRWLDKIANETTASDDLTWWYISYGALVGRKEQLQAELAQLEGEK